MARLKIFWTSTAVKQRNHIFNYWNERNKSTTYSKKLNDKVSERIKLLKVYPQIGKKTEVRNTRAISLGPYSILYRKVKSNIIITGFWDNRQNPVKLIEFLKNKKIF